MRLGRSMSFCRTNVALIGVEAGGRGTALGEHAARFAPNGGGVPGVLQGTYSYVLQNDAGQIASTHSVSAGLDYASVGPEHAMLHDSGRATYTSATDDEALEGVKVLSRTEGIIPALESAHAVAEAMKLAPKMGKDKIMIVNVSGRGDKDIGIMTREISQVRRYKFSKAMRAVCNWLAGSIRIILACTLKKNWL
jgi:tryptophan synthase beta chain